MTSHADAYQKWFVRFEIERKKRRISSGRPVPGFDPAPTGPDEVRRLIFDGLNPLGERRAAALCHVHRTTVSRWLSGAVQIPALAVDILSFHAEGIPPGCGDAWRGFFWQSDALVCPDGKTRLTARELTGAAYREALIQAYASKIADLERKLVAMTQRINWGSANDAYSDPQDVRSHAFSL